MMLKKRVISSIAAYAIMLGSPAWAGYQFYGASLDNAKWRSSGNRLECRLSQDIPGYGKATFITLDFRQFKLLFNNSIIGNYENGKYLFKHREEYEPYKVNLKQEFFLNNGLWPNFKKY